MLGRSGSFDTGFRGPNRRAFICPNADKSCGAKETLHRISHDHDALLNCAENRSVLTGEELYEIMKKAGSHKREAACSS